MNMAVCIKQVPATEMKIKPADNRKEIDWVGLSYVVNPYDEFAVEEALQIKERIGCGSVTAITVGPDKAAEALRVCLAVGVDQAIHVKDPPLAGGDNHTTSLVLTAVLKMQPYDIIFFGKHAIDDAEGAVGIRVADRLGLPHVSVVVKLEVYPEEKRAVAHRQIEGGVEVVEVSLPAVFTCQKGLNEPRYASLPGIMRAKQKPLTVVTLAKLGLAPNQVGEVGAYAVVDAIAPAPIRKVGQILQGDPTQMVLDMVGLLHDDAHIL